MNSTSINLAEYTLSGHRGQGSTAEGGGKIDKTLFRGMKCLCLSLFAALRAFNLQQGGLLHPSSPMHNELMPAKIQTAIFFSPNYLCGRSNLFLKFLVLFPDNFQFLKFSKKGFRS